MLINQVFLEMKDELLLRNLIFIVLGNFCKADFCCMESVFVKFALHFDSHLQFQFLRSRNCGIMRKYRTVN